MQRPIVRLGGDRPVIEMELISPSHSRIMVLKKKPDNPEVAAATDHEDGAGAWRSDDSARIHD